jgi:hypothetical protein
LKIDLVEAIRVNVRYNTPDEHGETRFDRYERMDVLAPELDIPEPGRYLWDWFAQLSKGVRRISEGRCNPITWADFLSWASAMGLLVHPFEYDILHAMDVAFRDEVDKELDDYRAREQERLRNK